MQENYTFLKTFLIVSLSLMIVMGGLNFIVDSYAAVPAEHFSRAD